MRRRRQAASNGQITVGVRRTRIQRIHNSGMIIKSVLINIFLHILSVLKHFMYIQKK